nr:hypothetical protein GCM10020185_12640 [Pseudomonas brassicacearum subsp. brassicacearum]
MSNPSNRFECRWQASGQLLAAYLLAQVFALGSLFLLSVPSWFAALGVVLCLAHGAWVIPPTFIADSSPGHFPVAS